MRVFAALVLSFMAACSDPGEVVNTFAAPDPPANLAVSQNQISLRITWADRSDNEDYFLVEYSTDGSSWSVLTQTAPNASSAELPQPVGGMNYRFRVSACNTRGCSAPIAGNFLTAERPALSIAISRILKASPTGVQIDALLSERITGTVTLTLRRAGETAIVFAPSQQWAPNLPLTVDFHFPSLDPTVTYEAQATLVVGAVTTSSAVRSFRIADL
jgi:hypothetical protein